MDFDDLLSYLINNSIEYKLNVNTAEYVSFKVGGIGSIITFPDTIIKLCNLVSYVYGKMKYLWILITKNCIFLVFLLFFW